MSDKEYTIADMLAASKTTSPSEFKAAFDDVFVQKVAAAIAGKREQIAQNYFNNGESKPESEAPEQDSNEVTQEEEPNENVEASAGS